MSEKTSRGKIAPWSTRIMIVAEAGVNHNGSLKLAKLLVDEAAKAGVDAVKFQSFKANRMVARHTTKAAYQARTTDPTESMLKMISRLELTPSDQREIFEHCRAAGITFLSSPFDIESVEFLASLGLETFKIPSGEITNLPYLRRIGALGKKVMLSTGMSDMGEVEDALDVLIQVGLCKEDICLLHCTTEYPASMEEVNLRAMLAMRSGFQVEVGYSDHTMGIEIPVAAAVLGARVIEKHLTMDRNMSGPDHRASLEPHEFKAMVKAIRNVERAMGTGEKKPFPSELRNREVARKSLVAARPIRAGEVFTAENVGVKRPGTGISPMEWEKVLGRRAGRDYEEDELLES